MALMKEEAVTAMIDGMKAAGINLVTSLSTHRINTLLNAIEDDPDLDHVPVAHEGDCIGICAGAWLGGKMPAFVAQNSGMILATYHLLDSLSFFGGFPMVMLVDQPGSFGTRHPLHFYYYTLQGPKILDLFHIQHTTVTEINKLKSEIAGGVETAWGMGRAACIFLAGNLYS